MVGEAGFLFGSEEPRAKRWGSWQEIVGAGVGGGANSFKSSHHCLGRLWGFDPGRLELPFWRVQWAFEVVFTAKSNTTLSPQLLVNKMERLNQRLPWKWDAAELFSRWDNCFQSQRGLSRIDVSNAAWHHSWMQVMQETGGPKFTSPV